MSLLGDATRETLFYPTDISILYGSDERVQDACTLAEMESTYDRSGGSMLEMLSYLLRSDTFKYRVFAVEGQP